jgi:hypothetical protein
MLRRSSRLSKKKSTKSNKSLTKSNKSLTKSSRSTKSTKPIKKSSKSSKNSNQIKYKWKEGMCVAPFYMPSSEYYVLHEGPTNETWLARHETWLANQKTQRYSDIINKSLEIEGTWNIRKCKK